MSDMSWEHAAEARAALNAIVTDPQHGVSALSSSQTMSNLLKDLLPDAPREKSILVAAAEAGLAGTLREHVAQGMDPATAVRLTASSFSSTTPFTPEACTWVTEEIAIALGIRQPGTAGPGMPGMPGGPAGPGGGFDAGGGMPTQVAPGAAPGYVPGQAGQPFGQPAGGWQAGTAGGQPGGFGQQQAPAPGFGQSPAQPGFGQQAQAGQPTVFGQPTQGGFGQAGQPTQGGFGQAGQQGFGQQGFGQQGFGQQGFGQQGQAGGFGPGGGGGFSPGVPIKPGGGRKRGAIIGGSIAAVIVLVIVLVVSMSGGGGHKNAGGGGHHTPIPTPTPTPTPAPTVEALSQLMTPPGHSPVGSNCSTITSTDKTGLNGLNPATLVAGQFCSGSFKPDIFVWGYQFDNFADYQAGLNHLNHWTGFDTPGTLASKCPPGSAPRGKTEWRADSNPKFSTFRSGQVLECFTDHLKSGAAPFVIWTMPTQNVVFIADAHAPNNTFTYLIKWWSHVAYG